MTIKGSVVHFLSGLAAAGPWCSACEKALVSFGHRYPMSRTVLSFCRHFGTKLVERGGSSFSRLAVFDTGGVMLCGGEKKVAEHALMYYFLGTITGQHEDERSVAQCLRRLVREGDVFFDLGANFGFYSLYVAPLCGKSGAIHAFEANPYLIKHLSCSAELNSGCGNILVNARAVGKESGKDLPLYDPEWFGCSSLYAHEWLNQGSKVMVPLVTIDEYVRQNRIERIDVMKIDIEGAELDAFQGMEETFRVCPPKAIICELTLLPDENDPLRQSAGVLRRASSAADPRKLSGFLEQKGYELWGIADDGRLRTWEAGKLTADEPLKLANAAFVLPGLQSSRPEMFVPL